ncbi:MAG: Rne/Rng family ribonuclease [Actinobacteria bacterium]|nr:Rne/Rng family ribonuclease [Actinomycetota bacterium]
MPEPDGPSTRSSTDANPERPSPPAPEHPAPADAAARGDGAGGRRRRGSRGGRNRNRSGRSGDDQGQGEGADVAGGTDLPDELPDRLRENMPSAAAGEKALVPHKPKIGDTRPAPPPASDGPASGAGPDGSVDGAPGGAADGEAPRRRRRRGRGRGGGGGKGGGEAPGDVADTALAAEAVERRRGRQRNGRPVGRYLMCVHVGDGTTQIAVLEGRMLIEHYVAREDDSQIHGNVYLGRVQNVLPGMEAAFLDIGTPKNAVLYRGDVQYDAEDVEEGGPARIEDILRARQSLICQVTKNPIGHKGARLTQEISLPGRFVVLIPNSSTYGISKRLPDDERKRLRAVLDQVKPEDHGLIVRTAAAEATTGELQRDVGHLLRRWEQIEALARRSQAPALLYREPTMAVRVIREEFNPSYRGVVIDDRGLYEEVRDYVASIAPELSERVEFYDPETEALPLLERHHVAEQLHKALDRKVWLPSGGSLIIERTEALTVIDVNTGRNVGRSSLEETVYRNNLEAAEEIAHQLRLRDIGGIIVIDFIDMELKHNRDDLMRVFRDALARDKTRTQVFEVSELGLVQMTRKRIGEGLLESMSSVCPTCEGRGVLLDSRAREAVERG